MLSPTRFLIEQRKLEDELKAARAKKDLQAQQDALRKLTQLRAAKHEHP